MADDVTVDHDLDAVALVLVERRRLGDVDHLAIDPDADEALATGALEDPIALGLAVLDQRAEDEKARALGQGQDLVHDLLNALALDRVAVRAVGMAGPGEQQAQVVVDLGHRADRGPRVARRALLVDRDRRAQAVDLVDVGLLHLAQELAGVGAQALDVAALTLGVDRVEGKAALAAPGQARDHHEPVTRERDRDVLQVVFAGTANDELILRHTTGVYAIRRIPNKRSVPCAPLTPPLAKPLRQAGSRWTSRRFGPVPAAAVDATRATTDPGGRRRNSLRSHAISPSRAAVSVGGRHGRAVTP